MTSAGRAKAARLANVWTSSATAGAPRTSRDPARTVPRSTRIPGRRIGSQAEHLAALVEAVAATLDRNPNFLRILVVMATQPVNAEEGEVHQVVNTVREMALERLRDQMQVVFGLDSADADADELARFALAAFDGAFVACQANPQLSLGRLLEPLPAALIAVRRSLASGDADER